MTFPQRTFSPLFAAALLAAAATSAAAPTVEGSGVARTEGRTVGGFHGLVLGVPARVEIRQGAVEALTITGDDNVVPLVETVVEGGMLKIRWAKDRDSVRAGSLAVALDVKTLDSITQGGSGQVHAARLATGTLNVKMGGSGDIVIDALDADSLSATLAGNARLVMAGRADDLEATLAGSGKLSAEKLRARRARTTVQGSADAIVWVSDSLTVTIAGSGTVAYYGRPKLTQTIVGSGVARQLADSP